MGEIEKKIKIIINNYSKINIFNMINYNSFWIRSLYYPIYWSI